MPQYNPDFILPTLARKPDTAHPYDEEFDEGTTLDAVWNARKVNSSGVMSIITMSSDVCSRYNDSSEFRINVNPAQRPSFLRAQPINGDNNNGIWRAVTVPDNFLIYVRLTFDQDHSINQSPEGFTGISLHEADSGDPSIPVHGGNQVGIFMYQANINGQRVVPFMNKGVAGGSPTNRFGDDRLAEGSAIEYLALHKVGTTYYGWVGTESNWVLISSFTGVSYNMTHFVFSFQDKLGDPTRVYGVDFIRFLETDKFPF